VSTLFIALRASVYAAAFLGFALWLGLRARTYDGRLGGLLPEWTVVPGTIVLVLGGTLGLICLSLFIVRGRGTGAPFDAPREFVVTGPYRWVRNPMYIGALGMAVGLALVLRSPGFLLYAAGLAVLSHLFVIGYEEPTLRNQFGDSYESYLETTRRWLPRRPAR
jgi:protein-S-isoprenylcysteine O-methyltransferase Ste14